MRKITISLSALFVLSCSLFGQELTLKEKAIEEFKNEHYNEAIEILEKAVEENPDDAEIYYYLGWYNHYLAYDSRPLKGYNFAHSEKIFSYLDRALELNPNYGDAKYFYGAECSGNAFNAMQKYDLEKLKYFYKQAFDKGAYPDWLISKLTPVDTKANYIQIDYSEMGKLLISENFKHYSDIIENDIPRISGLTFSYHRTLYLLAKEYSDKNEMDKLEDLIDLYDEFLQIGFNERIENYYSDELRKLKE